MPAAPQAGGPPAGLNGPPALGAKAAEQDVTAGSANTVGNAQVVMIVTASDVSTVQREVDQLLASNRIATDREMMPMGEVASNSFPNPIQQAMPSVDRKDEAIVTKERAETQAKQAFGGGGGGAGDAGGGARPAQVQAEAQMPAMEQEAAVAPRVVARNLSSTQLQTIRQNMLRLTAGVA